jgi:DNA (cytosine-5)-methyltransferase 1
MWQPLAELDDSMKPKIFSFFAGSGFLDLGFDFEGFSVSYVNEFHSPFLDAYRHARNKMRIDPPEFGYYSGSITDFSKPELEQFLRVRLRESRRGGGLVGFVGGPPCPDFSIGGKNRGKHGDNGKLSRVYVDLICHLKPDFFLFENVKGLWSTKRHREFYGELRDSLRASGYQLTHRLINAIEYGVPQDRERIILLGFRRTVTQHSRPTKEGDSGFPWLKYAKYPDRTAFHYSWPSTEPFQPGRMSTCPKDIPFDLTVEKWFRKNSVGEHPNAEHCFKPRAGLARFESVEEGDDSRKSFKRLHRWRYSPTACYGNNEVHLHPYKPRRISVAEALSIQSLPKEFELPPQMTLSAMFKTVGNGVPFLAARMIARSVKDFLKKPHEIDAVGHRSGNWETAYQSSLQLY